MMKLIHLKRYGALIGITFVAAAASAEEKLIPPPWIITGLEGIAVGVTWDESAVRRALPSRLQPAKEMTGGINIYRTSGGYGPGGAYSAAYLYVDLEGMDSSSGAKGRWMLAGVYGPSPAVTNAWKTTFALPIRSGGSRVKGDADHLRYIGFAGEQDLVAAEVKVDRAKCAAFGASLNYMSISPETNQLMRLSPAVAGESCPAEVLEARILAPVGDAFAQFPIKKVLWAAQFKADAALAPAVIAP
jgi:hypothetical protein